MNILILSNGSGYGGSERSVELICEEFVKQDNEVTVYVENRKHFEILSQVKGLSLIASRKGKSKRIIILEIFRLIKIIRSFNVIIANTNKAAFLLAILKRLYCVPKTTKCLTFVRDYQWDYSNFIINSLWKDIFCIPSDAVKYHLLEMSSKINRNIRVEIIPDMVRDDLLKIVKDDFKNDIPILLCASVIIRWKGIDLLLKAVGKIKGVFQLIVVGEATDDKYLKELHKLKDELKLGDKVVFKPFIPNLDELFKKCSVVINSSISKYGGPETFGRTIIEAWSYKKPVIAFNCGGPKYLIENDVNGILVPEGDIEKFSTQIEMLLNSEGKRKQLGLNGFNNVKEKYTVSKIVESINKLLN